MAERRQDDVLQTIANLAFLVFEVFALGKKPCSDHNRPEQSKSYLWKLIDENN